MIKVALRKKVGDGAMRHLRLRPRVRATARFGFQREAGEWDRRID